MQRRRPPALPERLPVRRIQRSLLLCGLLPAALCAPASHAQPVGRRAATLESLTSRPLFFHGTDVIVRADVEADGVLAYLVGDGNVRLLALDVTPAARRNPRAHGGNGNVLRRRAARAG